MSDDLKGFFQSVPNAVLAQFRDRYLLGNVEPDEDSLRASILGLEEKEAERAATDLSGLFGDRQWVRERLKGMQRSHHVALIALLQCQGVAGGTWLLQELTQAHGMSEDLWAEDLHAIGEHLLVFGNSRQSPPLFYIVPEPLRLELEHQFRKRLGLRAAKDPGAVRLSKDTNYRHPLAYSLLSFLAYIRQHQVKVTRADEVFKKHFDEMATFFANLWGVGSEETVLHWHLDLVRDLGLVRQRGGHLAVDELALAEYLDMAPPERKALLLAYFRRKEPLLEWLLRLLAEVEADGWVPQKKMRQLYRRRYMGTVFHRRFVQKSYYLPPSGYYDPTPPLEVLQVAGLVEGGLSDDGAFVRLSDDGRRFMEDDDLGGLEANDQVTFLLQPTFEILAPAGLPLRTLWRLGEVAELRTVDRANTFVLTRESVRGALDEGWRGDDLLAFLDEHSAVDLPQNVASTVRDWIGRHGEVEFHDALVVKARGDRGKTLIKVLRRMEAPFEKLAPGIYAVPREKRGELLAALAKDGVEASPKVRTHDLADRAGRNEGPLHAILRTADSTQDEAATFPTKSLVMLGAPTAEGGNEAVANRGYRSGRVGSNAVGADISVKPAAAGAGDLLKLSPSKTILVLKAAIRLKLDVEVLYPSTGDGDPGGLARVTPYDVTELGGSSHFRGRHHRLDSDLQFQIKRIKGIRLAT
jgi:hypothetical protein